jgi:hypothetical protein
MALEGCLRRNQRLVVNADDFRAMTPRGNALIRSEAATPTRLDASISGWLGPVRERPDVRPRMARGRGRRYRASRDGPKSLGHAAVEVVVMRDDMSRSQRRRGPIVVPPIADSCRRATRRDVSGGRAELQIGARPEMRFSASCNCKRGQPAHRGCCRGSAESRLWDGRSHRAIAGSDWVCRARLEGFVLQSARCTLDFSSPEQGCEEAAFRVEQASERPVRAPVFEPPLGPAAGEPDVEVAELVERSGAVEQRDGRRLWLSSRVALTELVSRDGGSCSLPSPREP